MCTDEAMLLHHVSTEVQNVNLLITAGIKCEIEWDIRKHGLTPGWLFADETC